MSDSKYERLLNLAAAGDAVVHDELLTEATRRAEPFGELAARLLEAPSPQGFYRVIELLSSGQRESPAAFETRWLPYARERLSRWRAEAPLGVARAQHWTHANNTELIDPLTFSCSGERALAAIEADAFAFGLARSLHIGSAGRWDTHRLQPKHGEVLAGNRALEALEGLSVSEQKLGPSGFAALVSSPHLGNLRALVYTGNVVRLEGAEALAKSRALRGLERLALNQTYIGDGGLSALATSRHLKNLKVLILDENTLDSFGMKAVAKSKVFDQLKLLSLNSNKNIGAYGVTELAAAGGLSSLKGLNLYGAQMKTKGLTALLTAPFMSQLESLDLGRNKITRQGAQRLSKCAQVTALRHLSFSGNKLGSAGVLALLSGPHLAGLESLALSGVEAGDEGIGGLARAALPSLQGLVISGNGVGPEGLRALVDSPIFARLETLNISSNEVGEADVISLAESPSAASLRSLRMYGAGVGPKGVEAIVNSPHLAGLETFEDIREWSYTPALKKIIEASPMARFLS